MEGQTSGRKVVVAVDDSPQSGSALRWAAQHLLHPKDELHIVHVLKPSAPLQPDDVDVEWAVPWTEASIKQKARAQDLLEQCNEQAVQLGVRNVFTAEAPAECGGQYGVGQALKTYALQHNADSVVLGSRGLSGLTKPFMGLVGQGSVSDYCVQHLPCSVVVHKPMPSGQTALNRQPSGSPRSPLLTMEEQLWIDQSA